MRIILVATTICFLISCSINKNLKTLNYPIGNEGHKLILKIPKGYSSSSVTGEYINDGFKYRDSSILYVTSESNGGINYGNIEASGLRSKLFHAFLEKDTITLSGIDINGHYWKNYFFGGYNIGYKNVAKEKKAEFDKVINDVVIK